mmetsp:Transcript_16809/g.35048  ORF Transcript_16809/g.35048 Transcript_16809/m.35048 type:complete len:147 (-) Transcript_16809:36-476(-)
MDWIEYELPLHSKDGTIRATITLVHNPVRLLSMYHIAVDGRRNQQATRKFFAFCRDLDGHLASNKNGRVVSQAAVEFVVSHCIWRKKVWARPVQHASQQRLWIVRGVCFPKPNQTTQRSTARTKHVNRDLDSNTRTGALFVRKQRF